MVETHEIDLYRCRVCEVRGAKEASLSKKKQNRFGLYLRWFIKDE